MKREYTIDQIAEIVNVTRSTVLKWIKGGTLKSVKLPEGENCITREDLTAFLNKKGIPIEYLDEEYSNKTRILIIEDDKDVLELLKGRLALKNKYHVWGRNSGFAAGAVLKKYRHHIVVLDVKLKDIDGRDICKLIKRDPELNLTKLVGISGKISAKEEDYILKQGFDVYLKKPFDQQ